MPKSPDAFRTISEVADWLGIQAHVLRFWESKFSQIKPVKRVGGRRYYRPADMQLIGGIKKLLHDDGLTIKEVQGILRDAGVAHVSSLSKSLDEPADPQAPSPASARPLPGPSELEMDDDVDTSEVQLDMLSPDAVLDHAPNNEAPPQAGAESWSVLQTPSEAAPVAPALTPGTEQTPAAEQAPVSAQTEPPQAPAAPDPAPIAEPTPVQTHFDDLAPAAEPEAPIAEVAEPVSEDTQPMTEAAEPVFEDTQPLAEAPAPAFEDTQPMAEAAAPAFEGMQPLAEAAAPAFEDPQPMAEAAEPAFEDPQPMAEAAEPAFEDTQPIAEAAEPAFEDMQPMAEVAEPASEEIAPMAGVADPAPENLQPYELNANTPTAEPGPDAQVAPSPIPAAAAIETPASLVGGNGTGPGELSVPPGGHLLSRLPKVYEIPAPVRGDVEACAAELRAWLATK